MYKKFLITISIFLLILNINVLAIEINSNSLKETTIISTNPELVASLIGVVAIIIIGTFILMNYKK